MTQKEKDYIETTKTTLTLLGYKTIHYKYKSEHENSFREKIYIEKNKKVIAALAIKSFETNESLLSDINGIIYSPNIILLCQHIIKNIGDN